MCQLVRHWFIMSVQGFEFVYAEVTLGILIGLCLSKSQSAISRLLKMNICINAKWWDLCLHSALSEDGSEVFLSPAVTYGPPGLDLSCSVAMTIAHCAEVSADSWTIRLKRQILDNKWEVSRFCWSLQNISWSCCFELTLQNRLR